MDVCDVCGEVAGQLCGQGHLSKVEASFCQTCGEFLVPLDSGPMAAPDTSRTEYTTGSFADFITRTDAAVPAGDQPSVVATPPGHADDQQEWVPGRADYGAAPVPHFYSAPPAPPAPPLLPPITPPGHLASPALSVRPPAPASPLREPAPGGATPARPTPPPPALPGSATPPGSHRAPGPGWPRRFPRGRVLALALGCLVLVAGVTAGVVSAGHRPGPGASPGPIVAPTGTGGQPGPTVQPRPSDGGPAGWSAPLPVGRPNRAAIAVTGISCPQPSLCYAVGKSGEVMESHAEGWWRLAATDTTAHLAAVSCGTPQFCMALDTHGNALIYRQGTWGKPLYIDARLGSFTAISCLGPDFCMAADSGGNAFAYSPGGWTPFSVDTTGGGLTGVSCPSPRFCVAVDTGGGAYLYNGQTWTDAVGVDQGHGFTGVSCPTTSFCLGVIDGGKAALFQAGKWELTSMPAPATAVDCPTSGFCVAVTGSGQAMLYRSHSWSRPVTIDPRGDLSGVSCATPTACLAGGRDGMAIYFH